MPNPAQQNLPTKVCPVCDRPFTWRKKWARDWENVKYCSKACAKQAAAKHRR
ncbi:MAG: DUF2256 domain-containing protein [Phycisphaeraceae bacterium]